MITYQIDKPSQTKVNSQIRDMENVLGEVPNTLQVLLELLEEQGSTISSPSINNFRAELKRVVSESITQTSRIADDAQRLVNVSEQAGKHLAAIEEHFGAVLRQSAKSAVTTDSFVK